MPDRPNANPVDVPPLGPNAPPGPEADANGEGHTPIGASTVAGTLAIVILAMWILMYALNVMRS